MVSLLVLATLHRYLQPPCPLGLSFTSIQIFLEVNLLNLLFHVTHRNTISLLPQTHNLVPQFLNLRIPPIHSTFQLPYEVVPTSKQLEFRDMSIWAFWFSLWWTAWGK